MRSVHYVKVVNVGSVERVVGGIVEIVLSVRLSKEVCGNDWGQGWEDMKIMVVRICLNCGQSFKTRQHKQKTRINCSFLCSTAFWKDEVKRSRHQEHLIREYKKNHEEQIKNTHKIWRANNKEMIKAYYQKRKEVKKWLTYVQNYATSINLKPSMVMIKSFVGIVIFLSNG